jgi:diguanylate cyclase (GGDEF)-like protein/putative nucleotidyltransferase with HDIG domain
VTRAGDDTMRREPRETSGMTSRIMLAYAEREGGRELVDELLRRTGLTDRETELRDENAWFSYATKIRLFEALADLLDDPDATHSAGALALELNVADSLKVALRALGSPRLVYQNVVRANAKFSARHRMRMLDIGPDRARVEFSDVTDGEVHPLDCRYTAGLLTCVPSLFGLRPARVSHPTCAARGAEVCVYDVSWDRATVTPRAIIGAGVLTAAAVTGSALAAPALLPAAGAFGLALAAAGGTRAAFRARDRVRLLEAEAQEQASAADRLNASLRDVVSELRLEEVLDKIVSNAYAAVAGKEFALLIAEGDMLRCASTSGIPAESIAAIEAWAATQRLDAPVLVEDVADHEELTPLIVHPFMPLGTLCATPLVYRGETTGVLVACAAAARTFLPRDVAVVGSYATQAAVALANARMYAAQRALATRDPLTGLLNHREFHEAVARELNRCRRHGGTASIALFDLDGFKLVNDGAGHAEGDRVLRATADALAEACRDSDVAFRIGGDEFAVLMPETDRTGAEVAATRVRDAVAAVDARTSTSYGIATWPADGGSKDVVLAQADANLYAMKNGSRRAVAPRAQADGATQRERLAVASRLSARLAEVLDPVEIVARTVAELHQSLDYYLAYIQRVDGDTLTLLGSGGALSVGEGAREWDQAIDSGVAGRVARTGALALVHDTRLDDDYLSSADVLTELTVRPRSMLSLPLRVGDRIWGVLSVEEEEQAAFGSDDVLLLETVGAQVAAALHRSELFSELDSAFTTTLSVLCDALESKDDYTASHAHDVGELARAVGERLGLPGQRLRELQYGALLHDIGKIAVRTEILNKPGPLDEAERAEMERHTVVGAEMLQRIPFFASVQGLVRSSHERWDGNGYPDRLAGEDIPLGARIVAACDAFHAMTSDRPYRKALPREEAVAELQRCSGTQFDPAVVEALIAALS